MCKKNVANAQNCHEQDEVVSVEKAKIYNGLVN